ncbi:MAG: prepilin peptidase, partial [Planctomycetota bacterium]
MPRLRRPYRWLLMCVTLGLLAFASAYVFAAASWEASRFPNATPFDFVRPRIMDMWIVTFFILVGASVGSFLNVVVWRLPRGRGVHGESECPHCKRLLRAQDNLPIIGWLLLGGRCRDCRLPISSRYLIVELLLAISFSLIGSATVFRVSLPIGVEGPDLIWDFAPRLNLTLLCVLLVHFVALSGLWAMALIRFDELSIPRSLIFFVIGALTLGFLAVPPSMVVPWQMMDAVEPRLPVAWPPSAWWRWNEGGFANEGTRAVSLLVVQTVVRIITALVAAGFIGRVLAKSLCPAADLKLDPLGKQ